METKKLLKRNIIFIAVLALLYLLCDAVLSSAYTFVCSDVLYSEGYLPFVLELAMDICQLFIWCHIFTSLIFFAFHYGVKGNIFPIIFTAITVFFRYLGESIISSNLGQTVSNYEITNSYTYFALDISTLLLSFLAICMLIKKSGCSPNIRFIRKTDSISKRIRITALISAVLVVINRIGRSLSYDMFFDIYFDYVTILYFFADLFYGVILYLLILLFINLRCKNKASA